MRPVLRYALRELGPRTLLRFGQYRLGLESGWIRRKTPIYAWDDRPFSSWLESRFDHDDHAYTAYRLTSAPELFLPAPDVLRERLSELLASDRAIVLSAADDLAKGFFSLFGFHSVELGFPPDWHRFAPLLDEAMAARTPTEKHWSEIDLLELPSDVKLVWEVNRFGWVFPLARAYVLTGDKRYFEIMWELVRSWRAANPPNLGINWFSAQEVSIRMLALVFALYAFQPAFAGHPERVAMLAQMVAAHAERIPPSLSYAIAQGNNHLLVEAVGLYTAGMLFPEFKQAGRWRGLGSRWFIRAMRDQVSPDGGYIQHSVNYHRLALQAALWAARLSETGGEPLPTATLGQIDRMTAWLERLVDPSTGAGPNFGPNDGAEILPLSILPFDDQRPTLQAARRLLHDEPRYGRGLWDEWSLWLGVLGREPAERETRPDEKSMSIAGSGLQLIAGREARGYLRAGRFHSRPGHADQMHLDLWFGPFNIAMDAGSYLYNADPPWDNALSGAAHHNTVLVDGVDAMIPAGRFLWLAWNQAKILGRWQSHGGDLEVLAAERPGDLAGEVTHRRTVVRAGDRRWFVIDDLLGVGDHRVDLNWLLPDLPCRFEAGSLVLSTPVGEVTLGIEPKKSAQSSFRAGSIVSGPGMDEPIVTYGWFSPTYALKIPAIQLVNRWEQSLPLRIQSKWFWVEPDLDDIEIEFNPPTNDELPAQRVRFGGQYLELDDAYSVDPSSVRRVG
jgi:hypothetical protein